MFGSHLSISGGLYKAADEAKVLGFETVQIFTKNQQQWKAPKLTEESIKQWKAAVKAAGLVFPVSHDSYLINLASPSPEGLEKSIAAFEDELERCEALDVPYLVTHPGAHMGTGVEAGVAQVAKSLDEVHSRLPGFKTLTLLEVTAGQGSTLGAKFEEIRAIIDLVKAPERVGVCLDTAHMIEAGYDLESGPGAKGVIQELDKVIGLKLVKAVHVNDSKTPRGSRVDRHAHIGQGHVSLEAFKVFMKAFKKVPKILETPKEDGPDGRPMDAVNAEILRGM
jgi:deoxyribonuclease IV